MKYLILLFLMPVIVFALPQTKRINTATTNIPSSFSTAAGSLLISEAVDPAVLIIDNRTTGEVEVNCAHVTEVPTSSEGTSLWVASNITLIVDRPAIKGDCYVRSVGVAITSGIFSIGVVDQ